VWCYTKPADQPAATLAIAATIGSAFCLARRAPPLQDPHLLLMLADASCIAAGITDRDVFPNGHSDVMSGSSIAMPFIDGSTHPPWPCHAHALCCHSRWPSCQLVSYIRKTAATFHIPSSLLAILPIVTPKLPNSQSITRLLYDYYDLAPVNDCCCACPPATLVNTPTTPSRLLPTERHPR